MCAISKGCSSPRLLFSPPPPHLRLSQKTLKILLKSFHGRFIFFSSALMHFLENSQTQQSLDFSSFFTSQNCSFLLRREGGGGQLDTALFPKALRWQRNKVAQFHVSKFSYGFILGILFFILLRRKKARNRWIFNVSFLVSLFNSKNCLTALVWSFQKASAAAIFLSPHVLRAFKVFFVVG